MFQSTINPGYHESKIDGCQIVLAHLSILPPAKTEEVAKIVEVLLLIVDSCLSSAISVLYIHHLRRQW